MFEAELTTNILINAGAILVYIAGLIGFIAWQEHAKNRPVIKENEK